VFWLKQIRVPERRPVIELLTTLLYIFQPSAQPPTRNPTTMARTIPDLPRLSQPAGLPTPKSTDSFWHTEPSPLLLGHRSTRGLPSSADVVIIGSGITGASIARHLLKEDGGVEQSPDSDSHDVVMLEAREACWGATGRVSWLSMRSNVSNHG
jgi:hypothetical protein